MVFEKDIEQTLIREAKKLGGLAIKVGYDGLPDRLILLPQGRAFFVELKRADGRTSKLQEVWIARLHKLGFRVYVPKSKAEVHEIFRKEGMPYHI